MTEDALLAFRDRFDLPLTDEQVARARRSTSRPTTARRCTYLRERREALGGCLPARRAHGRAARDPAAVGLRRPAQGHRRARDLDDDGLRADPQRRCCATRRSAATSSRSCPTSRARSAWRGCSASSGSSPRSASSTSPRTPTSSCSTGRTSTGQILQEGINEAGAMSSWIAAATAYANHGVPDDPVLHLLLDVRLPADRRPGLGRGRQRARAASCSAARPGARR